MFFQLPHKHKIVIAGNHELTFDPALRGLESELSTAMGGRCDDSEIYIPDSTNTLGQVWGGPYWH